MSQSTTHTLCTHRPALTVRAIKGPDVNRTAR